MSDPNPYATPDSGAPAAGWQQPSAPADPRFGTPPYGQPALGQPAYGQPAYGATPAYPPPAFPPPAYPPQAYGQSAYPPQTYSPSTYPAPGYGLPAPTFKGNQGLGVASLVLGGVFVAFLILQALTAPSAVHAYDAALAQGIDPRTVGTAHDIVGILALVGLPLWIVTSIWLSRARANAAALAPSNLRRSAVWCWLGWLVPIVSLWFPKQIVDDSWRITAHQLSTSSPGRYRSTGLWWGLWVAFSVVQGATWRANQFGTDPASPGFDPHVGVNPWLELLVAVLGVAAFAAWVPVALGVSRAQEELKARFSPTGY